MLRVRTAQAAAGVLAALLAVGGCTASSEEQAAASPEVAWAETVCGAVADGAAKVPQLPRVSPGGPEKAKQGFVKHLKTLSGALDGVRDAIKEAGAPPVADAKAVYSQTVRRLGKAVKSISAVTTTLADTDATDQKALRAAMSDVEKAVAKAGSARDLVKKLRANDQLDKVMSDAAACRGFKE